MSIKTLSTLSLVAAALALINLSFAAVGTAVRPSASIQWLRVPDDVLSGKGINDQIESATRIERPKNADAAAIMRKAVYAGQLRTSVVQMKGDNLHLPSFPDDEVFCVIVGSVILTADETKLDQVFFPGDCGFVPEGWAGVWRQPDSGMYREVAVVPTSFSFAVSLLDNPPVKGARAFAIDPPRTPGTHQLHRGTLVVEVVNAARDETKSIDVAGDQTIQVLHGNLTLKSINKTDVFKPGDIIILPQGLKAEMRLGAGCRALVVRTK